MTATPLAGADRIVGATLSLTWAFYLVGALYVVGPVLGWCLGALALVALYLGPAMPASLRAAAIPPVVLCWIGGMAVMLVALWIGHIDWGLGTVQTIKSSIGWAKGWALMALFPLAGAVLPMRRAPLIRAYCLVGAVTLALLPVFVVAPVIGLPQHIFTSPLKAIGGPGPEYFAVFLYTVEPGSGAPRWQFFAPWSPFAGLIGVLMVLFAREEPEWRWRWAGIAAGIAMVLMSRSRMSLVALPLCLMLPSLMPLMLRSWAWALLAMAAASLAVIGDWLMMLAEDSIAAFRGARADSTRVRDTLQNIAYERWWSEAIWFGHGTVQPGPHLVEYMPIGSHHTWFGLLFVKGIVGLFALAVPLGWQIVLAVVDAVRGRRGRLPLGILMVFVILSFGENIEIEAYMLWPALLLLGIHAREVAMDKRDAQ